MNHSCLWLVAFMLPYGTARAAVTDCNVWQLLPNSAPVLGTMTFTAPGQAATVKASVGADATILLFCDLPNGAGIAAVEWKP
jgi:hypothetical protein